MKTLLHIKKNPFVLLLATTFVLLLALAFRPVANIDFQDKTIFSAPLNAMIWAIPLLLMSFWLIYLLTKNFLYSATFTWAHVLLTIITTLLILTVLYIGIEPSQYTSERHELIGNAMQMLSLVFVFVQLIYLANVSLGLMARYKTK